MIEQNNITIVCQNGHRQPVANTKFCIFCGISLNVQNPQPDQQINQPQNQVPVAPIQPTFNQPQPPQDIPDQSLQRQQSNNPQHIQENYQSNQPAEQNFQAIQNQPQPQFQPPTPVQIITCNTCGGNGQKLEAKTIICKECNWLRPLISGYRIDSEAFAWAADAKAMSALRAIKPLDLAAKKVSEMVGRRWIESTFNGILLGEKQLPHIYALAVKSARIIGMTHMPDIYISGERPWDCLTFGTENDSFIVIGSAIAGNFQGPDMFFLLAREMGHCHAGHALWKSVIRFLMGEQSQSKGFMAGGIMNALKGGAGGIVAGVIEVPLLAWARQAEITADRAGMLCIGNEEIARRVLISWSLKSSFLFKQINIQEWLRHRAENEDDGYSRLSEMTTSSTPYLNRRLKLLSEYAKSSELHSWRKAITDSIRQSAPKTVANPKVKSEANEIKKKTDFLNTKCAACQTPMRIPFKALAGKEELPVKCPNQQCGKITQLKKSVKQATKPDAAPKPNKQEENMNYGD